MAHHASNEQLAQIAEQEQQDSQDAHATQEAMQELTILFPNQSLLIGGKTVKIKEYPFVEWLGLRQTYTPFIVKFTTLMTASDDVLVDDVLEFFENEFADSVEKLGLFIDGLNQAQSSFQQFLPTAEQLNDRITNGLADAFFTFADGTKSAEQAFREFASAFFREIAQMILKQMIFNAISTAGKAGGGGWGGMVAGVLGSAFGGKGYATGGYAGKGGKYEPAGIVHRDEFVIRKEMTNQVGAKEFLAQFNRYGMNAIKDLQGYSSGGLVGASMPQIFAPNIQAPKLSSPSEKIAQSTSLNNQQNFYLVDDPSRILDTLSSSQGQENLVVMMSRDPEKFKTALRL